MRIIYEDEYENELFNGTIEGNLPRPGDSVVIQQEEWFVSRLTFYPEQDAVLVSLVSTMAKSAPADNKEDTRLAEMQNNIMQLSKRQESQEKQARGLSEQLVSVRSFLRNRSNTKE